MRGTKASRPLLWYPAILDTMCLEEGILKEPSGVDGSETES